MPKYFYCHTCLKKCPRKGKNKSVMCPICNVPYRPCKTAKSRAQTVTRLARMRGIKPKVRQSNAKRDYQKYLQSDIWKQIRLRVLERDKYKCCDCGSAATQVHHESYAIEVLSGHDDSKLVSICRPCHKLRHPDKVNSKKRRKNPASGIQP